MRLFIALLLALSLCRCSIDDPNKPDFGHPWSSIVGKTYYILQGSGAGLEKWVFYEDSLVGIIDYFSTTANGAYDSMEVKFRERRIGKVCQRDQVVEGTIDGVTKKYLATELQWKQYYPSLVDVCIWTPIYDWSNYQFWCIEEVNDSTACVGEVPWCYTIVRHPMVNIKYPAGFVPFLCGDTLRP